MSDARDSFEEEVLFWKKGFRAKLGTLDGASSITRMTPRTLMTGLSLMMDQLGPGYKLCPSKSPEGGISFVDYPGKSIRGEKLVRFHFGSNALIVPLESTEMFPHTQMDDRMYDWFPLRLQNYVGNVVLYASPAEDAFTRAEIEIVRKVLQQVFKGLNLGISTYNS
jgi:hypothetical protein